jgi:hypothetical protein
MPGVSFFAYGTLKWGVNVACGDIDGDGIDEIVTGPGPGSMFSSHVRAFNYDGSTTSGVFGVSYIAYPSLTDGFGVFVACGDADNDRVDEILTAPGPHPVYQPWMKTWNCDGGVVSLVESKSFLVFEEDQFRAGARLALGNFYQEPSYLP